MAEENPRTTPGVRVALTIAGSDSGGGAGIQADVRTFTVMNVFAVTAVTAITAQNTTGVKDSMIVPARLVERQLDAIANDMEVHATKTGMLPNADVVGVVVKAIQRSSLLPLVVDPVMVTKEGDPLINDDGVRAMQDKLLPLASLVTPNRHEAARLLGQSQPIEDIDTAGGAAAEICRRFGAKACLIKGFKRDDEHEGQAVDVFFDGEQVHEVASAWRPTPNTHGAGCVLASAITAGLAKGQALEDAIPVAKELISEAIRQTTDLGAGKSPVNPMAYLKLGK